MPETLCNALNKYCHQVSVLKKGYSQEKYRIAQITRSFLGALPVRAITSVHIAQYRDLRLTQKNHHTQKAISSATVRLEMSLLSHFFEIGRIEWGLCESNPVANVRKPKTSASRERTLTPREERLILRYAHAHSNPELYSIIVLAIETAMRQGEILGLLWEHINLQTGIAHLPQTKNGTKRDVPLSLKARDALVRTGVKAKGKVFCYTPEGLKSTWRFMLGKLNIEDLHFHDCRHHAITKLFQLGTLDMMEVAAISGHKSLGMLKRYTHLKAAKLVKKLEGNKHKGRQILIENLIPYPAIAETTNGKVTVRMLDLEGVAGTGLCVDTAIKSAQDALLRKLVMMMRNAEKPPEPNQYLEHVPEQNVLMIDPLGEAH